MIPPFLTLISSFSNAHKRKVGRTEKREKNKVLKQAELQEIQRLKHRIQVEAPPAGSNPLAYDDADTKEPERVITDPNDPNYKPPSVSKSSSSKKDEKKSPTAVPSAASTGKVSALLSNLKTFEELPLSSRTKQALKESGFTHLTKIQRGALPHALAGRDVLGAARTGSGKTLAFLIPVLERLFLNNWDPRSSGLGALILSPTRELAIQIFDVLRLIGKHHEYAAGLVIGGKDLKQESQLIGAMNILVCTPGRLLQHMDQTYDFDCSNLQILVLDEADRILDMGFSKTLDSILENLPPAPQRQTLLFSGTQTKEVRSLARLSLSTPEYIDVHEADPNATPIHLSQHYMVVPAGLKIDVLYSFLRTHLKNKIIVFLSSCKQVRLMYECLRRVRPGITIMHLHGKMKQPKRMSIYYDFCNRSDACLLATDIAARGLDFPDVDWVIQLDCPDSPETYIHRVGRTARYRSSGHALTVLLPSEEGMVAKLKEKKVPLKQVKPDAAKLQSVTQQFASILAEDPDLKYLAQKAFISYIRSVHLQADKSIFNVKAIDTAGLTESMGLAGMPTIKALKGSKSDLKNMPHALREMIEAQDTKKMEKEKARQLKASLIGRDGEMTKIAKLLTKRNVGVLHEDRQKLRAKGEDEEDDDDFMKVKRKDHDLVKASKAEKESKKTKSKKEKDDSDDDSSSDSDSSDSDDDDDHAKAVAWAKAEGLIDSDYESSSEEEEEEETKSVRNQTAKASSSNGSTASTTASSAMNDKEKKKALKKEARKKQIEERLRQAMLSNNVSVMSVEEAVKEGLDTTFVSELREMVKKEDATDKARDRERVKALHRKQKERAKAALKKRKEKGNEGEEVRYVLGGTSDEDDDGEGEGYGEEEEEEEEEKEEGRGSRGKQQSKLLGKRSRDDDDDDDDDDDEEEEEEEVGKNVNINLMEDSDDD